MGKEKLLVTRIFFFSRSEFYTFEFLCMRFKSFENTESVGKGEIAHNDNLSLVFFQVLLFMVLFIKQQVVLGQEGKLFTSFISVIFCCMEGVLRDSGGSGFGRHWIHWAFSGSVFGQDTSEPWPSTGES